MNTGQYKPSKCPSGLARKWLLSLVSYINIWLWYIPLVTDKKFIIYTAGDEGDGGKDGEDNIYVNNDNNDENDNENNNKNNDENNNKKVDENNDENNI